MTLEQAIDHAESKGQELGDCQCAAEHFQLAEWLKELKTIREQQNHRGDF